MASALIAIAALATAGIAHSGPRLATQSGDGSAPVQTFVPLDAEPDRPSANSAADDREMETLAKSIAAVTRLKARALPEARSLQSLGAEREGSAILIGPDNLLLTIGYLVVEAETVEVENRDGRFVPATVVGYDPASGFALVRALTPLGLPTIALGSSAGVDEADGAIFAVGGGIDAASSTVVMSKRRFAGYWEYMIDDALFTSPPRFDHSGAALIDRHGRLVGVGSLIVADVLPSTERRKLPGNLFVPIDLLKPIIDELLATGSTKLGRRPWIGVTSQEVEGRVFVQRVQKESPAEEAGLQQGDILLAVGPQKISKLEDFYTQLWKNRKPGDDVPLTVLQGNEIRRIVVKSIDRNDYSRHKSAI